MKKVKAANLEPVPKDYEGLMAIHVLRPIHDDIDLANAAEIVDRLAVLDRPTRDQADYLEALSTMVEAYENEQLEEQLTKAGPMGALKFLLSEHEMSGSDLGRLLGSRTLGPAILRGARRLSRKHILTLARRFRVDASLFLPRP